MRLFVAAELPDELTCAVVETTAELRSCMRGRFVASDSLHATLAFLGQVDGHRLPALCDALEDACQGHTAFDAELAHFGSFGKRSKATLWQGFRDQTDLAHLAADVRDSLARAGFSFDGKGFVAHITLMRGVDLSGAMLPSPQLARGTIRSVALFESDLSGPHPRYTALYRIELPPPAPLETGGYRDASES